MVITTKKYLMIAVLFIATAMLVGCVGPTASIGVVVEKDHHYAWVNPDAKITENDTTYDAYEFHPAYWSITIEQTLDTEYSPTVRTTYFVTEGTYNTINIGDKFIVNGSNVLPSDFVSKKRQSQTDPLELIGYEIQKSYE